MNFLTEPSGADTDNIFSYDDYTYLWEMAPSNEGPWEEADGTNNQETYSTTTNSVVVETTTWYRCIVTSVDCGDVDITDPTNVTFLTELDAGELDEEIENTVYCYEDYITINFDESQLPSGANGINDYSYQWYYYEQGEFQPINNSPNEPSFSTTLFKTKSRRTIKFFQWKLLCFNHV